MGCMKSQLRAVLPSLFLLLLQAMPDIRSGHLRSSPVDRALMIFGG